MDFISALEVSYGSALLAKLNRHVRKDGAAFSLAPSSATPSYLWFAKSADETIVDVKVLYDDEAVPQGYKKVARDLSGGSTGKVFLAFRTSPVDGPGIKPLLAIHLIQDGEAAPNEPSFAGVKSSFVPIERSLMRAAGAPAVHMYLEVSEEHSAAGDSAAAPSAWAESLKAGDFVDCLDKGKRWRAARVAAVSTTDGGRTLTISFKGWSAKHDEELPRNSKRLARPGSHTAGKDTRAVRRQGDAFDVDLEVLASLEMRIDDYISGEFPQEERDAFAKGELPQYLETVLSSKYESEELRDRINVFNEKVMELCVYHMKRLSEPLPPEVRQHLQRLFLDDNHCDYFFQHYGGIRPEHELAAKTNGFMGRLPGGGASRYYVSNLNHFHRLGGYDAMLLRLNYMNDLARLALAGKLQDPSAQVPLPDVEALITESVNGDLSAHHGVLMAQHKAKVEAAQQLAAAAAATNADGGAAAAGGEAAPAPPALPSPPAAPQLYSPRGGSSSSAPALTPGLPQSSYGPLAVDDESPLGEAYTYSAILYIPHLCYTSNFGLKYYQPLRDAILERVLTLSDQQLKKAPRELIDAVRDHLFKLGNSITKTYDKDAARVLAGPKDACAGDSAPYAAFERWSLALSVRLLRSDSLAHRVRAVTDIRDMVDAVNPDNTLTDGSAGSGGGGNKKRSQWTVSGGISYYNSQPVTPQATWFNVPKLLRWLKDNKVVDVLLGSKVDGYTSTCPVHIQTVSKLHLIVAFLANRDMIARTAKKKRGLPVDTTTKPEGEEGVVVSAAEAEEDEWIFSEPGITKHHLDRLFTVLEAEWGDHELRKVLLEVFACMVKYADKGLLDYCHSLLKRIPYARYDESLVEVLKSFSNRALMQASMEIVQQAHAAHLAQQNSTANNAGNAGGKEGDGEEDLYAPQAPAQPRLPDFQSINAARPAPSWEDESAWYGIKQLWGMIEHFASPASSSSSSSGSSEESGSASTATTTTTSPAGRAALVQAASNAVIELASLQMRYKMLAVLLDLAVAAIRNACNATASLVEAANAGTVANPAFSSSLVWVKLADSLMRSIPLYHQAVPMEYCSEQTAERLQKTHNLSMLLVQDMQAYKAMAVYQAKKQGLLPSASASAGGSILRSSEAEKLTIPGASVSTHAENVSNRLAFYLYILRSGEMVLKLDGEDGVKALWTCFVDGAISEDERETFFRWLTSLRFTASTPVDQAIADRLCPVALVQQVCTELFCGYGGASLSDFSARKPVHWITQAGPSALRAFKDYLLSTNGSLGHMGGQWEKKGTDNGVDEPDNAAASDAGKALSAADAIKSYSFEVVDYQSLKGVDTAWNLALQCGNREVSKEAIYFLIALHTRVRPSMAALAEKLGEGSYADAIEGKEGAEGEGDENAAAAVAAQRAMDRDFRLRVAAAEEKGQVWSGFVDHCMSLLDESAANLLLAQQQQLKLAKGDSETTTSSTDGESFPPLLSLDGGKAGSTTSVPSASASAASNANSARTVAKVLRILTTFLSAVEAQAKELSGDAGDGGVGQDNYVHKGANGIFHMSAEGLPQPAPWGMELPVTVMLRQLGDLTANGQREIQSSTLKVTCRPQLETLGALRDRVAEACDKPYELVRFALLGEKQGRFLNPEWDKAPLTHQAFTYGFQAVECETVPPELDPKQNGGHKHIAVPRKERIRRQLRERMIKQGIPEDFVEADFVLRDKIEKLETETASAPRASLSKNEDYFDTLFALLSSNSPSLVSDAWELVQTLPVNAKLQADVHTLKGRVQDPTATASASQNASAAANGAAPGGAAAVVASPRSGSVRGYPMPGSPPMSPTRRAAATLSRNASTDGASANVAANGAPDGQADMEWPAILDGKSPLKLLYSLQIVATVLDKLKEQHSATNAASADGGATEGANADTDPNPEIRTPWAKAFVRSGGLQHLHHLLVSGLDLQALLSPSSPRLLKECARLLVSTYARFVLVINSQDVANAAAVAAAAEKSKKDDAKAAALAAASASPYDVASVVPSTPGLRSFSSLFVADRAALVSRLLVLVSYTTTGAAPGKLAEELSGGVEEAERKGKAEGDEDGDGDKASASKASKGGKPKVSPATSSKGGAGNNKGMADDDDTFGLSNFFSFNEDDEWEEDKQAKAKAAAAASGDGEQQDNPIVLLTADAFKLIAACLVGPDLPLDASVNSSTAGGIAFPLQPSADDAALAAFTGHDGKDQSPAAILLYGLMAPEELSIRGTVARSLIDILSVSAAGTTREKQEGSQVYQRLRAFLLKTLLSHVDTAYAFPATCASFFGLVSALLNPAGTLGPVGSPSSIVAQAASAGTKPKAVPLPLVDKEVVASLAGLLKSHPVVEVGSDEKDPLDSVLHGLLSTLKAILVHRGSEIKAFAGLSSGGCDLVEEVFEKCLFAMPNDASSGSSAASPTSPEPVAGAAVSILGGRLPKCKKSASRRAAFDLLSELAVECLPSANLICEKFLPHHDADAADAHLAESQGRDPLAAAAETEETASTLIRSASAGETPSAGAAKSSSRKTVGGDDDDSEIKPTNRYQGISSSDYFSKLNGGGKDDDDQGKGGAGKNNNMSGRSKNLSAPRSSTGYVGLRNLGCICYMNSTMQQFFMTPAFRRAVLSWQEPADSTEAERADSIMYQLQRQFAYLQESEKQAYNPKPLCMALKDWEGNPINVAEQQDVPEFLTKLFSDMETQSQGTNIAFLAKDVFGLVTVSELVAERPSKGPAAVIPKDYPFPNSKHLYSASSTPGYFLQMPVKGKGTLYAALDEFTSGENVDYKWEFPPPPKQDESSTVAGIGGGDASADSSSGGPKTEYVKAKDGTVTKLKVELKTSKRTSIKSLSEHLMIHLNRFEFDVETMQQKKVNDRFEFPLVLDMWPYTAYGRDSSQMTEEVNAQAASFVGGIPLASAGLTNGVPATASTPNTPSVSVTSPSEAIAAITAHGQSQQNQLQHQPSSGTISNGFYFPLVDRSDYIYELVGIVVHMGTAIGGHYYSYIRERDDKHGPGSRWFEFNDSFVTPWEGTQQAMERDCFGGREVYTYGGGSYSYAGAAGKSAGYTTEREKSSNAFCLFYDRVRRNPGGSSSASSSSSAASLAARRAAAMPSPSAGLSLTSSASTTNSSNALFPSNPRSIFESKLHASHGGSSDRYRAAVRAPIPADLLATIQAENLEFWRLRTIYELDYFACVRELVRSAARSVRDEGEKSLKASTTPKDPNSPSSYLYTQYPWAQPLKTTADAMRLGGNAMPALRLCYSFMTNTLTDSNQKATLPLWLEAAYTLLHRNPVASAWIVQSMLAEAGELRRMLVSDVSGGGDCVREIAARVLDAAISVLWPIESLTQPEDRVQTTNASSAAQVSRILLASSRPLARVQPGRIVTSVVDWMTDQLPRLHKEWRRFQWFFWLLDAFATTKVNAKSSISLLRPASAPAKSLFDIDDDDDNAAGGASGALEEKGTGYPDHINEQAGAAAKHELIVGTSDRDGIRRGMIGRLVDFALSGAGPHPELNDQAYWDGLRLGLAPKRDPETGRYIPSEVRSGMGDNYTSADVSSLMDAVRQLVTASKTLTGHTDSTEAQPPQLPLDQVDIDELTCRPFVVAIMSQIYYTRPNNIKTQLMPLITHLFWKTYPGMPDDGPLITHGAATQQQQQQDGQQEGITDEEKQRLQDLAAVDGGAAASSSAPAASFGGSAGQLMATVLEMISRGIIDNDFDGMKQWFRLAGAVMDVGGDGLMPPYDNPQENASRTKEEMDTLFLTSSYQMTRIDGICRTILDAIRTQMRFWQPTEMAIELFVKLARTRPMLRQWMAANADAWSWCEEWYNANERVPAIVIGAPKIDDGVSPRFTKKAVQSSSYSYYGYNPQPSYKPIRDSITIWNMRALLEGATIPSDVTNEHVVELDTMEEYLEDATNEELSSLVGRGVDVTWANGGGHTHVTLESYNPNNMEYTCSFRDNTTGGVIRRQFDFSYGNRGISCARLTPSAARQARIDAHTAAAAASMGPTGPAPHPAPLIVTSSASVGSRGTSSSSSAAQRRARGVIPGDDEEDEAAGGLQRQPSDGGADSKQADEDSDVGGAAMDGDDGLGDAGSTGGALEGGQYDDDEDIDSDNMGDDGIDHDLTGNVEAMAALHIMGHSVPHLNNPALMRGESEQSGWTDFSAQSGDSQGLYGPLGGEDDDSKDGR